MLRTWSVNEIPNRAPPLPEGALHAMVGWSLFKGHHDFALSLLVGYYALLRTGELCDLKSSSIFMTSPAKPAVISLGFTKGGKRAGAAESCTGCFQKAMVLEAASNSKPKVSLLSQPMAEIV